MKRTILVTASLLSLALAGCGKQGAQATASVKSFGGPYCGQVTPNTRVCLSSDGNTVTLSNPVGARVIPVTSSDSTLWDGATDYIGTGDLSFVAGFGWTTIKLTYLDGQARLGYTGTPDGVSAAWYNWPGTTNDSSFTMTPEPYQVPCCKH